MWVVYRTASPFAQHVYDARFYLRKIDIRTGNTIAEQPIAPGDSQFDPNKVMTRTGLLLAGGGFGGAVCDDQPLPAGFQSSAAPGQPVTAVWRNPNHLDLFAAGADGRVMSIVWQPPQNQNSGWQSWFAIGSSTGIAAPGQPVTAVWRNPNHLDRFITDRNGRVISTYFDNNAWQPGWFAVAPATGSATPGQPVTAVWSNANHLDLFIAAPDGRVLSTYFDNNNWLGSWFSI